MGDWGNKDSTGGKAGRQGGSNTSTGFFGGPGFDGLYTQKRPTDGDSVARRHSLADQYRSGFIARAWQKYVSAPAGPTTPSKPT